MYIIEKGKAYLLDGEVGYSINFDTDGKMVVEKEETIDAKGKAVYTFDEMYAKLNIAYNLQEIKKKNALKEFAKSEFEEYEAKIAELEKENSELKALIEELENAPKEETENEKAEEEKSDADEEPKVDEEPEEKEPEDENKEEEPKEENNKKNK